MFSSFVIFFFFNDTATTEIYTLSLHDALPILRGLAGAQPGQVVDIARPVHRFGGGDHANTAGRSPLDYRGARTHTQDRKSTRLNSSHSQISYAVFCLKKKKI